MRKWPIFICYRQSDGKAVARRTHGLLHGQTVTSVDPESGATVSYELDVYFDQAAPAAGDWTEIHEPYLKRARAFIVICTPGAKLKESKGDWVHQEIDWWLENNQSAPVLIDALGEEARYIPDAIATRWPNTQRVRLVEDEWSRLDQDELKIEEARVQERLIGGITNTAEHYLRRELEQKERQAKTLRTALERQKMLSRRFKVAFFIATLFLVLATGATWYAFVQQGQTERALISEQGAKADAVAARKQAESALDTANEQRNEARQQVVASTAYAYSLRDPTLAIQLAADSYRNSDETITSSLAMLRAFNTGSWFYSHRFDKSWSADISSAGTRVAWIPEGGEIIRLQHLDTGIVIERPLRASWVRFCPNGHLLAWTGPGIDGDHEPLVSLMDDEGHLVGQWKWHHVAVHLQADGFASIPSFSEGRSRVLHIIDTSSGTVATWPLESESLIGGIGVELVVFDQGKSFLVADSFPDQVIGVIDGKTLPSLDLPDGNSVTAITVDPVKRTAVLVLRGDIRGIPDAIAWAHFDASGFGPLKMLQVPPSQGESGARVHALPDHRVFATSTTGWTRIVDLQTKDAVAIDQDRGFDALAISGRDQQFAIARRSGDVSIYDYEGNKVGVLLAETGSDGLNPQFEHVRFTADGSKVLTQSRLTTRVWLRPRYTMSKVHDETFRPFQHKISNTVFNKVASELETPGELAKALDYRLTDTGMFSLSITFSGRPDYLPAFLSKDDLQLIGSSRRKEGAWLAYWTGNNMDRIFVLSPQIIATIVEDEVTRGRLWRPASGNLGDWIFMIAGN